jgi:hypothetical protein
MADSQNESKIERSDSSPDATQSRAETGTDHHDTTLEPGKATTNDNATDEQASSNEKKSILPEFVTAHLNADDIKVLIRCSLAAWVALLFVFIGT